MPAAAAPARRADERCRQGADGENRADHRDHSEGDGQGSEGQRTGAGRRPNRRAFTGVSVARSIGLHRLALGVLADQPDLIVAVSGLLQVRDGSVGSLPGREHTDLRRHDCRCCHELMLLEIARLRSRRSRTAYGSCIKRAEYNAFLFRRNAPQASDGRRTTSRSPGFEVIRSEGDALVPASPPTYVVQKQIGPFSVCLQFAANALLHGLECTS